MAPLHCKLGFRAVNTTLGTVQFEAGKAVDPTPEQIELLKDLPGYEFVDDEKPTGKGKKVDPVETTPPAGGGTDPNAPPAGGAPEGAGDPGAPDGTDDKGKKAKA